ncbi:MAG: hypothetical protein GIW95_10290 [Candidatus Eremiobacteraeota bacterium]|nr:hypothetical protein [Candidatus Eremiobacteraeota bacterium]
MQDIEELLRLPSPAPFPQSLAFDGECLWMGSRETRRLYCIDARRWTVREEVQAPGTPWGMTVVGDELRVVCGETDEDNRIIRRFVPGHGFKMHDAIPCPDDAGSQLSYDGDRLYLSQWYNKRILSLDEQGHIGTVIDLPHQIAGHVVVDGCFYVLTTEDKEKDYWLTRVDARNGSPKIEDIARIPFPGRALAYDGEHFWTNHREAHEIVSFARPAA